MANKQYQIPLEEIVPIVRNLDRVPFDKWGVEEQKHWKYGAIGSYEFSTKIGEATARIINHGSAEWFLELEEGDMKTKYRSTGYLAERGHQADIMLQNLYKKLKLRQESRKKEEQQASEEASRKSLDDLTRKFSKWR